MNFIKDILNFRSIDFYSNLDQNAQQTLNFDLPTKSIQIGKQISPELYSHYSLGHGETFLGYAFKSERRILYGRIYGDGRLDGVYSNKPYKNVLTLVSGTSSWDSDSHLQFQVISDQRIITNELAWNTDNVLGYSNLVRLTKNWAFGSELFYTFSESSGGSNSLLM